MSDYLRALALETLEADDPAALLALRQLAREAGLPPPEPGLGDPADAHVREAQARVRDLMLAHVRGRLTGPPPA
jgi:hypothetical protein